MKKIPVSEQDKEARQSAPLKTSPSFAAPATAAGAEQTDAEDPMAGAEQFGDDRGADPARSTGDEYAHDSNLLKRRNDSDCHQPIT